MNWRLKLTILLLLAVTTSIIFAGGVLAQGDPDLTDLAVVEALAEKVFLADDRAVEAAKLSDAELTAVLKYTLSPDPAEMAEILQWVKSGIDWAKANPSEWTQKKAELKVAERRTFEFGIGSDSVSPDAASSPSVGGSSAPSSSSASGCDTNTAAANHISSLAGDTMWHYESSTRWCWQNRRITSVPFFRVRATAPGLGWQFVRNVINEKHGGVGHFSVTDSAIGKFKYCFIWCRSEVTASVFKYQHADGTHTAIATPTCVIHRRAGVICSR